ncbi:MAG: hypothetical protein Q9202_005937 [Teloschistes flavicans]
MICTRCLLFPRSSLSSLARHIPRPTHRLSSSSSSTTASPPPATSTSAAQPFSTPFTPSPHSSSSSSSSSPTHFRTPTPSKPPPPRSSMAAGAPLKGLNFVKGRDTPLAREDGEYPNWLWGLLEAGKFGKSKDGDDRVGGGGDLFSKSAKQRKLAARAARRAGNSASADDADAFAPDIPVYEQSIDLPAVEGGWRGVDVVASEGRGGEKAKMVREVREGLTRSLRTQRRKGIKEKNFLKGIR